MTDARHSEMHLVEVEALLAVRNDEAAIEVLRSLSPEVRNLPEARRLESIALWNTGSSEAAWDRLVEVATTHFEAADEQQLTHWIGMASGTLDPLSSSREWAQRWPILGAADLWASEALKTRRPHEIQAAARSVGEYRSSGGALLMGHAALLSGDANQAATEYRRVAAGDPDLVRARTNTALVMSQLGRHQAAQQALVAALHTAPEDDSLASTVGRIIDRASYRNRALAGAAFGALLVGIAQRDDQDRIVFASAALVLGLVVIVTGFRARIRTPPEVRVADARVGRLLRRRAGPAIRGFYLGLFSYAFLTAALSLSVREASIGAVVVLSLVVAMIVWLSNRYGRVDARSIADLGFTWTRPIGPAGARHGR